MKALILAMLLLISGISYGQQEPIFAQFSTNPFLIQPALAGSSEYVELRGSYRLQWGNLPGSPRSLTASLQGPFNEKNGGGIFFLDDELGVSKTQRIQLAYAFHIPMARDSQRLSIGAGFSYSSFQVNTDRIFFQDPSDQAIQGLDENYSATDLAFGIHYTDERAYIGISSPNLLRNELNTGPGSAILNRLYRNLYLLGGYRFAANSFEVEPVVLLKSAQGLPLQVEGNLKVHLVEGRVMFGMGYRSGFRGSLMAGFTTPSRIHILYIADFPTSPEGRANVLYGISNELMLGIDFVRGKRR
ncbi:MAG: type IX secretion system membrane protein PorP/SprF [Bacteroidota bacterium]